MVRTLSIIGTLLQIAGGVFSIYGIIVRSTDPDYKLLISISIAIPFLLLNFFASAIFLLTKSPKGVLLLLFHFLLQTIQFKFLGFYYFYSLGPYLGFGIVKKAGQEISFWWDSSEFIFFQLIRFVDDKIGVFFTINVVAIFFVVVLILEYRERKSSMQDIQKRGLL